MKSTISIILFLFVVISGCGENKPEERKEIKSDKSPNVLMTEHTTLSQSNIEEVSIKIPTSVCRTCEKNIKKAVTNVKGVTGADVDADKKIALVKFDKRLTGPNNIREAISKAGYDADNIKRDESAYQKLDECCKAEKQKLEN